jgi:hypothetical protein
VNNRRGKPANPSKAVSNWLSIVEDVFPRWRDRLGSSKDAKDELNALLCDRETRSAKRRVNASGEEIPGTPSFEDSWFWQDQGRLLLVPDADGGVDHLAVDYTDSADVYWDVYSPGWHWEFYVRRLDVERWEGAYFPITASSPPAMVKQDVPARKPRRPASEKPKKPKKTQSTRLISLMEEIGLEKSGLLPHEVRTKVSAQFKKNIASPSCRCRRTGQSTALTRSTRAPRIRAPNNHSRRLTRLTSLTSLLRREPFHFFATHIASTLFTPCVEARCFLQNQRMILGVNPRRKVTATCIAASREL